ncbi:MAG TPA: hypothetical protein VG755_08630 [Nannocystaceae bacterium]|nr:hypothetical protein [Nannocystaceae bacterium]
MIAILLGFALALLIRPGELLAKQGPHSVGCGQQQQIVLQAPRRPIAIPGVDHLGADDGAPKLAHPTAGIFALSWSLAIAREQAASANEAADARERHLLLRAHRTRGPPND